jgi:KUP system potassium uptake protein
MDLSDRTDGDPHSRDRARGSASPVVALAALGIVYGDIGTSPLYAIRECFRGEYGIQATAGNVLGVLSLMFWTLVVVVSLKYLTFVLRADNSGEGGVIALTALVDQTRLSRRGRAVFVVLGLFAAALLYGDGMITPAISVLSAVEGLRNITPLFEPYVLPATTAILAGLFLLQRKGTAGIGALFGPVTLAWFIVLALLGLRGLAADPGVLAAVNPWHGAQFLARNRLAGFLVLGAVFLVVTGAEALYADLGHFGRRPIRRAWYVVVLPCLLCNYFGQGALLLRQPGVADHPFYALAPPWAIVPLVVLATAATIIASQAVISGAFSLTQQAIQMGYLPRLRVVHTSAAHQGQIYIPAVNLVLMLATIVLVFTFRSSSHLAAAYGVAVTSTMLISTMLFFVVARSRWHWSLLAAGLPAALFLVVDLAFFSANVSKILHGAWFPLAIGAIAFVLMTTWQRGRRELFKRYTENRPTLEEFLVDLEGHPPPRVPGAAIFMTSSAAVTPPALLHNLKHNRVLHEKIGCLVVESVDVPRVPRDEKVEVQDLDQGFYRIVARFGFMEEPSVPYILALAKEQGVDFELGEVSFFLGRERLLPARRPALPRWRRWLFAAMSRNALGATSYFNIPPAQVIELGTQVEL